MTDPGLRASDTDRERVVTVLQQHTAAGRLSLDEFSDRVGRAMGAVTLGELAVITRDLPVEPPTHGRQLVVAFVLAVAALVLLGVVLAVFR